MNDSEPQQSQAVLLTVAYEGTELHGFAPQPSARTVYGELLLAVQKLDPSVQALRGVSRTDAGVHAWGQLVAFDPVRTIPSRGWVLGLGHHLPSDISVRCAGYVPFGFDPRHHAVEKHYAYTLLLDACRDPLVERLAWRVVKDLDLAVAQTEAQTLVGTHDFSAFRSSADERINTERTLSALDIRRSPSDPRLVTIDVRGSAFLHNMVRIIVGSLVDLARGSLPKGAFQRAIDSGQRSALGTTAPAKGLCLRAVQLDQEAADRWPAETSNASKAPCNLAG